MHPVLQRRRARHRVGQTCTTAVEHDNPYFTRQLLDEASPRKRGVVVAVDAAEHGGDPHQGGLGVAVDAVGQPHVTIADVVHSAVGHLSSVAFRRSANCRNYGVQPIYMRTDNDTWDITSSVGATALFVAASRALEANKPDPVVVDPYAEMFCRAVGGEWADVLDGKAPENRLKSEFGGHFVNYQAARTKYFDDYFDNAADAGVRQIVIPAAGLDSRAYRLAWPEGTVVFELDQPQVLEFKRDVLTRSGESPTAERREIAVDLRDDWPAALRGSGFDPSRPSAWIVEGLLVYLPAAAQGRALQPASMSWRRRAACRGRRRKAADATSSIEAAGSGAEGSRTGPILLAHLQRADAPANRLVHRPRMAGRRSRLGGILRQVDRPVPGPDSEAGPESSRQHTRLVRARRA